MALPPLVLQNGAHYSHASGRLRVLGMLLLGVTEWSYKITVERGEAEGSPRELLGHTIGKVKYEFTFKVLRAYWDALTAEIRAKGMFPMDARGMIVLNLASPGLPSKKIEILIDGLNEMEGSSSKGVEAHEVPITCSTLNIKEDGKNLIADSIF